MISLTCVEEIGFMALLDSHQSIASVEPLPAAAAAAAAK